MLRSLRDIENYALRTQDGATAVIKDFIVDDFNWLVRYLVAEVGDRLVALSTTVFADFDDDQQLVHTRLNEAAILDGPVIDLDRPLSRQDEEMLNQYYGWTPYWQSDDDVTSIENTLPGDLTEIPLADMQADIEHQRDRLVPVTSGEGKESHLRSAKELIGYSIVARDEDAGKLSDILIQSSDWDLHYLVVDTGGLFPGKKVILSPQWVQMIDGSDQRIQVDLDKDVLHKSPELNEL
jgi:hypothetical protein